jgi:transposase
MKCRATEMSHEVYYPVMETNTCAICGEVIGNLHFRGKMVCEDCRDLIKAVF